MDRPNNILPTPKKNKSKSKTIPAGHFWTSPE